MVIRKRMDSNTNMKFKFGTIISTDNIAFRKEDELSYQFAECLFDNPCWTSNPHPQLDDLKFFLREKKVDSIVYSNFHCRTSSVYSFVVITEKELYYIENKYGKFQILKTISLLPPVEISYSNFYTIAFNGEDELPICDIVPYECKGDMTLETFYRPWGTLFVNLLTIDG